ncbi:MAG: 1-deoxy-D-xylulose-5-phosphate synthase [Nitrospira sp.]|nr:1-deoxy-D-xylulose-5-phosphate synthase [Nitrospira sp.]
MGATKFILGMRDRYFNELYKIFERDPQAIFITADNGAPTLDQFARDFPDRFINVGIAEQQLIGMACGMAFEGKKVYVYAIAPFVSLRCYEQVKLDVCAMNLPIVLIGVGAGYAYDIMGPSHHTVEDISIMRALPNLKVYSMADGSSAAELAQVVHQDSSPQYIRFDRAGIPEVYASRPIAIEDGLTQLRQGKDVCIIATGVMVHTALAAADILRQTSNLNVGVIDAFRIKPMNAELLKQYLHNVDRVVTLEEHLLAGGLGSAIAELLIDHDVRIPTMRIGQNDRFVFEYGGRNAIWEKYGLDVGAVTSRIVKWVRGESAGAPDAPAQTPQSEPHSARY